MNQPQTHFVDLLQTGSALTVQWRAAPGADARPVEAELLALIGKQVSAVAEAQRRAGLARDVAPLPGRPPAGPALAAAQRALGETLYRLLDGPDRALARRVDEARRTSAALHLVVRLRTSDRKGLARHPALSWPFQLVAAPGEEPLTLALDPPTTILVQLGEAELAEPEKVAGGRLQVLFMAYSPQDVRPVLDYEAEEERILIKLAPHVEKHRLVLRVAEEGSVAELRRRLMDRAYDVVHLTGHGVVTKDGARLVMEDADGRRDDVSAERLLEALRDGRRMPSMVVISSCHSAEQRDDLPSLAAELIEGGVPCVVGWTLPVLDTVATDAAQELYLRLCNGDRLAEAVAQARRKLHREDQRRQHPAHAWSTLQTLSTRAAGFAIDRDEKPKQDAVPREVVYRRMGKINVLTEGFVGRRRELQALGGILRRGRWAPSGGEERAVAGALVVGMKGQGKSCLVARALERHEHDAGELSTVVLHGALDELAVLEAFRIKAVRPGDDAAEQTLNDASRPILQRMERLLRRHWCDRRVVIVLDDFEQNLEVPGEGDAQLRPFAAAVLEALLPICRDEQPRLLITSTARFALPGRLEGLLAEVPLGALEASSVQKLWARGYHDEFTGLGPAAWRELCERFGRNARLLEWARQLLGGKPRDEVKRVMAEAGRALPIWKHQPLDEAKQEELVAAFLRHMAFEEATRKVGPAAMTFIHRARVYEDPVPAEAFAGLVDGLEIALERHVPALANLGLLELGSKDGRAVYRVSPLVKAQFDEPDGERWHGVAAEYWWRAAELSDGGWHMPWVMQAWQHALAARQQELADRAAALLADWLHRRGLYAYSASIGARHVARFPESAEGLRWLGAALVSSGELQQGRKSLERALEIEVKVLGTQVHPRVAASCHALARAMREQGHLVRAQALLERSLEILQEIHGTQEHLSVAYALHELGRVLHAQGQLAEARSILERSLQIKEMVYGTQEQLSVATSLHELAAVLYAQGELARARSLLARALEIQEKLHRTQEHPDVAASLQVLAGVLHAQGERAGARSLLEHVLEIQEKVYGTQVHPNVADSLHVLAMVLLAQGHPTSARAHLERALEIQEKVHGTQEHPSIASSLHTLASALRAKGDMAGARSILERALKIREKVHGTQEHPDVASSLHALAIVLHAQGDLTGARSFLERSLEIKEKVHGTQEHPDVAASRYELARALQAQGDLVGAQAQLERSLEMLAKVPGTQHPNFVMCLHALAGVLRAQGDMAEARAHLERSLEILSKVHGTMDHPDTATSYDALGHCLAELGLFEESEGAYRTALEIREKLFGTRDHYLYAETEFALAMLLRRQERHEEAQALFEHVYRVLRAQAPDHPLLAHFQLVQPAPTGTE